MYVQYMYDGECIPSNSGSSGKIILVKIVGKNLCWWFQYNPFVLCNVIIRYQGKLSFCQILRSQGTRRIHLRSSNPLHSGYVSWNCAKINSSPQGHRGLLQRTIARDAAFRCAAESYLNFYELSAIALSRAWTASVYSGNFYLLSAPQKPRGSFSRNIVKATACIWLRMTTNWGARGSETLFVCRTYLAAMRYAMPPNECGTNCTDWQLG